MNRRNSRTSQSYKHLVNEDKSALLTAHNDREMHTAPASPFVILPEALTTSYYGQQSLQHRTSHSGVQSIRNFKTRNYVQHNQQKYQYPRATLTSLCLTICGVFVLAINPIIVPPLLFSMVVLYGLDLANVTSELLIILTMIGITALGVLQAVTVSISISANRWIWIVLEFGIALLFWCLCAIHGGLVLCTVTTNTTTYAAITEEEKEENQASNLVTRQLQSIIRGLVPLFTALWCTRAVAEYSIWSITVPIVVPLVFSGVFGILTYLYHPPLENIPPPSIHMRLLVIAPPLMHLCACFSRITNQWTVGMDDVMEFLVVSTLPILQKMSLFPRSVHPPPQFRRRKIMSSPHIEFLAVAMIAFISMQQRYLLSLTMTFSRRFLGESVGVVASTLYGITAVVFATLSVLVWKNDLNEWSTWLGDYHEDAIQLGLALTGLCVGKLFGLPWSLIPLPILAFLGLTLWIATRMLRYLVVFLFVIHMTAMVIFMYRFGGMSGITINVVGLQIMSIIRFGLVAGLTSTLIGLTVGVAVRSCGGWGYRTIKKTHVVGVLLSLYSLLLSALEITLLRRSTPSDELIGVEWDVDEDDFSSSLYDYEYAIGTSIALVAVAAFLQHMNIVAPSSALVVISINLGKAFCLGIDWRGSRKRDDDDDDETGYSLFARSLLTASLIWVMFSPQIILSPVQNKAKRRRSSLTLPELSSDARRTILVYLVFVLPAALLMSIPTVLMPLAHFLSDVHQYGLYSTASYSSRTLPIVELISITCALWGLACLSMLNHYLPEESTCQGLKKTSTLCFLIATLLLLVSPLLGSGISSAAVSHNPYASMSSLGSQLMRGKQRSGAWGLLTAAIATLLSLSGPLELRERRIVTAITGHSKRDRFLLLRTMIFSLLFGGGLAWFVVLQNLRDVELGVLVLTGVSCLSVACMGTVATVLCYFLELEAFQDAEQVIQLTLLTATLLLPVSGISALLTKSNRSWFGPNGWLETYLAVVSLTFLSISVCLRHRFTKDARTASVANTLGISSWVVTLSVLYGRFGISGIDFKFDIFLILGMPVTFLGTLLVSLILLVLEGEGAVQSRNVVRRPTSDRTTGDLSSSIGLSLTHLCPSNRYYPVLFGSITVFLVSSLYSVCIRGSGRFLWMWMGHGQDAEESLSSIHNVMHEMPNIDGGAKSIFISAHDLGTFAQNELASTIASQNNAALMMMATSSRLLATESGFWTCTTDSCGWWSPSLHLISGVCILPTLRVNVKQVWFGQFVPLRDVMLTLPLLVCAIVLGREIALLQAAAWMSLGLGLVQAMWIRQGEHASHMRI